MNRKLLIGIAAGALALVLAGGAVFAGELPIGQGSAMTQAATPTARPNAAGPRQGARQAKRAILVRALVQATADATGTQPKDVLAALQDGKSLAQYAQEHGKTGDDVVKNARSKLQDRLDQAVTANKITSEQRDTALAKFDEAAPKVVADANLGQQIGRAVAKRHPFGAALVRATADVTGTQPKDVLAALQAGKSLAQYAQEHGKTGDDILAKLREQGNQRLDKALERAKQLIDQPGLGRGQQGDTAAPAEGAGEQP